MKQITLLSFCVLRSPLSVQIRSVCDGYNVAVLAYGQTGSGKTYTMMGPSDRDASQRGITYRAAEDLFNTSRERKGAVSFQVAVQMLEIYNEQVRDLLKEPAQSNLDVRVARNSTYNVPDASTVRRPPHPGSAGHSRVVVSPSVDPKTQELCLVQLSAHLRCRPCVRFSPAMAGPGAHDGSCARLHPTRVSAQVKVENAEEVAMVIARGEENRAVGFTAMNAESTRSHCCLIIHVERQEGPEFVRGAPTTLSTLTLVDLAGSERVGRAETAGERLKEAQNINRSLSSLGDVIAALQSRAAHIPFRNSKLTMLLQPTFASQGKVVMLFNVSPLGCSVPESISTLTFAQRVRCAFDAPGLTGCTCLYPLLHARSRLLAAALVETISDAPFLHSPRPQAASVELAWRGSDGAGGGGSGSERQAVVQLLEQVTSLEAEVAGRRAETNALRAALADERLSADLMGRRIEDLERKLAEAKRRGQAGASLGSGGGSSDAQVRGGSWPAALSADLRTTRIRSAGAGASDTSAGDERLSLDAERPSVGEGGSGRGLPRGSVGPPSRGGSGTAGQAKPVRATTSVGGTREPAGGTPPHHTASLMSGLTRGGVPDRSSVPRLFGEASLPNLYATGRGRPRSGPMERRATTLEQVQRPANSASHVRLGAAAGDSRRESTTSVKGSGTLGRNSASPPSHRPSIDGPDTDEGSSISGSLQAAGGSSRSEGGLVASVAQAVAASSRALDEQPLQAPPAPPHHDDDYVDRTRRMQLLRTSNTPLERRVNARRRTPDTAQQVAALATGGIGERRWDPSVSERAPQDVRASKSLADVGRAVLQSVTAAPKKAAAMVMPKDERRSQSVLASRRRLSVPKTSSEA